MEQVEFIKLSGGKGSPSRGKLDPLIDRCALPPYMLSHFQVGTGADSVTEASTVKLLGKPLTESQYGLKSVLSVNLDEYVVFEKEDIPLQTQHLAQYYTQGVAGSGITTILFLDEETANGNTLNEVGLFVRNPFIRVSLANVGGFPLPGAKGASKLLGGPQTSDDPPIISAAKEDPGCVLAAYRQYTPIRKESFFSLLFRWTIYFTKNCPV